MAQAWWLPMMAAHLRVAPMSPLSNSRPASLRDELLAPATQIVRNRADYLGEGLDDVGQRIAEDRFELFVAIDPAQAMLQQFAALQPQYIALHDVGAHQSLRLLTAIAAALNTRVHTLAIRRQGHGVALAVLPFVELPGRGSQQLRVYSTDIDTDSQTRRALARVLLSHARLGVVMVGEMPAHLLERELQPLRDAIHQGPWPNRELLLVPQGFAAPLAAQATRLAGPRGMQVRVTPRAGSAVDAWSYITGAWNRLRESMPTGATAAERAEAPTEVMPLAGTDPEPQDLSPARWADYLQACAAIKGLMAACVFELRSGQALAQHGTRPGAQALVSEGLRLFGAMASASRGLGLGPALPDAAITLTGYHLLLHPLPGHPGIVLHAVLDASTANLMLARMQLQRIDATLLAST